MNNNAICTAIVTRLQADQGAGALFATGGGPGLITGVYRNEAPSSASTPYVVFTCDDSAVEDTFRSDVLKVTVRVQVWIPTSSPPGLMDTILDRIYGDATLQSSGIPSYGLHRHNLVLATGTWTGGTLVYTGSDDASDRDYYSALVTFEMHQNRTSP